LHLSLQSGDNMILKRMKRRHAREDSIAFCAALRAKRPDMVFGADIIAGFPTETDAMFENSLRLVDECGLTFLHVFPFSPRPGTPAALMPAVEQGIIRRRATLLREKGAQRLKAFLASNVGLPQDVLVETPTLGRTRQFALARFKQVMAPGALVRTVVQAANDDSLDVVVAA
jgi:threonylcarbamoyladenosine tRNA methylthiotransferase MtaB